MLFSHSFRTQAEEYAMAIEQKVERWERNYYKRKGLVMDQTKMGRRKDMKKLYVFSVGLEYRSFTSLLCYSYVNL